MSAELHQDPVLHALAEAVRRGDDREPRPVEVEALLVWLTRGEQRAPRLTFELGRAGEDTVLLKRCFVLLDRALFVAGRLSPGAAGVAPGVPEPERRARYRQLMAAFHPDRFPELSHWLTPRSQAIHQAYAYFKKHRDGRRKGTAPRPASPRRGGRHERWGAASYGRPAGFRERVRRRFGGDRRLPQKLLLLALLIALIPVSLLYLSRQPGGDAPAGMPAPVPAELLEPASLQWSIPEWAVPAPTEPPRNQSFPFPEMLPLRLRGRVRWEFGQTAALMEEIYETARAYTVPLLRAAGWLPGGAAGGTEAFFPRYAMSGVLARYIKAVEAQNLEAFGPLFVGGQSENPPQGLTRLRRSYGMLFARADALDFTLQVNAAEARGENWWLEADYALQIVYPGLRTEARRGTMAFTLTPEAGGWRIAAIDS